MRSAKSFTLIEILVVITIIVIGLAMAVPAIAKFSAGQALENGGQTLKSAVSAARNAAITKSSSTYLICFRQNEGVGKTLFGFRVYEKGNTDGDGFSRDISILLPNAVSVSMIPTNNVGLAGLIGQTNPNSGCRLAVFDGSPSNDTSGFSTYFDLTNRDVKDPTGNTFTQLRFSVDGTATFFGCDAVGEGGEGIFRPGSTNVSLYNPDMLFEATDLQPDLVTADIVLRQAGTETRRCYADIDPNTGRARYRVISTADAGQGSTTNN